MKDFGQNKAIGRDPLPFAKMAGGGNDFVMIDNRSGRISDPAGLTRFICTRRLSVGGDGLILVEPSDRATFRMIYFNRDGSRADFCANGTRCSARFAFLHAIAPERMTIETDAGIIGAGVDEEGMVTLALPSPGLFRGNRPLEVNGTRIEGSSILVGVPHYVLFVTDDLWSRDVETLGRAIREHRELQPEGANVNFVRVRGPHEIEVRTYERGVEQETLSCGSGVVASVAVSALFDHGKSPVVVLTRSGIRFEVTFVRHGDEIRDLSLKGDARVIYRSTLTPETLEGFDPDFVRDPAAGGARVLAGE